MPAQRRVLIIGGSFAGLCCARDLKNKFLVTIVDAKEYFEYTPGVLRAYVKPKHLDALTFTLSPVIDVRMGCKYIWGEVLKLNGEDRTAEIQPIFTETPELIDFDYCIIAAGCNFNPAHKWGESLWFGTIHACARNDKGMDEIQNIPISQWPQFDERYLEGRRRHILDEYKKLEGLNNANASIVVVGAGFIGVEWVTELEHFFKNLSLGILDMLPQCLGPLPKKAALYCTAYMQSKKIRTDYNTGYCGAIPLFGGKNPKEKQDEFYNKIGYPNGTRPTKEFVCMGVKASNYFMPKETLSLVGPMGQAGWILVNGTLGVVNHEGKRWGADEKGYPRVYAIGDCNYGCIPEEGHFGTTPEQKKKVGQKLSVMPIPKISYPGEEEAVIACSNLKMTDKIQHEKKLYDFWGQPKHLHNLHWPWGAGMFATSLGPDDACFVAGANWNKGSGTCVTWGSPSAVQKEIIEASKVDECANGVIGRCIWHFVHHTPFHLWGQGPLWGFH